MKKYITSIALAISALAFITGCEKKSNSTSSSPYTMTATKGSTNYSFSGETNVYAVASGPLLEIVGATISGSDTTGFILLVGNYTGPGTYTVDGMTNAAEYVSTAGGSGSLILGTSGTIKITSATSPKLIGTFNFSDGTTSVTNGTFTAKF